MVLCCNKFKRKNQLKIRDLECEKKKEIIVTRRRKIYMYWSSIFADVFLNLQLCPK